jgi:integrase
MILGGNRRSESLLLQMNHLSLLGHDKYFEIVKDDSPLPAAYAHKKAPSVKTKGRKVALNDDIAELIFHYAKNIRPQFEGYKKVSHLFLSTRGKGKPLSVDTPNKITDEIVKAFPEYKRLLCPHRLRNTFCDLLNDALDETIDPNLGPIMKGSYKSVLLEYAGGWSRGSQMAAKYPAGSIERRVAMMTVSLQENILSGGNNNNKGSKNGRYE